MKVYVHHEAPPAFTKIVRVDAERHVHLRDVVDEFVKAFNAKHPTATPLSTNQLTLHDADHRPLQLGAKACKALCDHGDLFVKPVCLPQAAGKQQAATSTAATAPAQLAPAASAKPVSQAPEPGTSSTTHAPSPTAIAGVGGDSSSAAAAGDDVADKGHEQAALLLQQYLAKAHQAALASNFRLAGEIFAQLLELLPGEPELLARAATMWLKQARQPQRALGLARRLVQAVPATSSAHELLGDCCMALGKPQEAVQHYDRALTAACTAEGEADSPPPNTDATPAATPTASLQAVSRLNDLQVAMAQALYACGQEQEPALKDVAAKLVMGVLDKDEAHWECLRLYAQLAEDQGLHMDVLRVALRLLVTRSTDTTVRALLARRLQASGGIVALYEELGIPTHGSGSSSSGSEPTAAGSSLAAGMAAAGGGGGSSGHSAGAAAAGAGKGGTKNAAALAFLAMCVKDHGAVDATIELLQMAVSLDPTHAGYALNLAHAWELRQRLDKVVQVAAEGMGRLGHLTLGGGTDLQACAAQLRALPPLQPPVTSLSWWHGEPWQPPHATAPSTSATPDGAGGGAGPAEPAGGDQVAGALAGLQLSSSAPHGEGAAPPPASAAPGAQAARDAQLPPPPPNAGEKVQYSSQQLDLLALAFTAAKALYVGGALAAAARLVAAVLPARDASQQPLHTTLIRNEAAYFGCVLLLVTTCPPPPHGGPAPALLVSAGAADGPAHAPGGTGGGADGPAPGQQPGPGAAEEAAEGGACGPLRPLYLLGDSHCLSAAWHVVTLRSELRLLHPVLVTGCKIWHVRAASDFYPKAQFQNSVAALPAGAQLVVLLGEIDCREGLLLAVQKCKYASLAEGVDATLRIYLDEVLPGLVVERGFEVFVHPVPPVLNETRSIVALFNQALRSKVQAAASKPPFLGRLHYLDFANDLLSADGASLAPGLHFDGTHLAPAYVSLLARELAVVQ